MSVDQLVQFLLDGDHPMTMDRYESIDDVRDALSDGVLLIRCTDTRGTTELSCEIVDDPAASTGVARDRFDFTGELTLNDFDLRVSATVGTADLAGTARFVRI